MANNPTLTASVVVPAHNASASIGRQLEALANQQDAPPFEVIVVANRCTDDTAVVARSFSARVPGLSDSIRQPLAHLEAHPWCRFETTFQVQSLKLDTWRLQEGIESVDLIWADVQGAEVDLIRGGAQTLASTRYLYTKCDDRELYQGQLGLADLLQMLPGWEIEDLYKFDALLRNTGLR